MAAVGAPRVLVLDHDEEARNLLCGILETDGYVAVASCDRADLTAAFRAGPAPSLVVTSVDGDPGLDVLDQVRGLAPTPVIVVSSLLGDENVIRALRRGADDCITKPFSERELLARVDAVLRRAGVRRPEGELAIGDLRIDVGARRVWVCDTALTTTRREFDLLAFLAAQPGRVFTRGQLLREVWGSSPDYQEDATVTEHIRRLRRKLESVSEERYLHTFRGVGYCFDHEAVAADRTPRAARVAGSRAAARA